jgi:4-amino-4-deoxy-L-arabinose transferase-like glycosyltransferase
MKFIRDHIFILLILILAAGLRLYQLGATPPSPDWDEAALGYNAYSVLKTGRDEYGIRFPLSLRSYDDYKPPLYMYLAIPSVAVFGLNTWAVRLPSAIAGILAVWGTYLFVGELLNYGIGISGNAKNKKPLPVNRYVPLLTAFLLAVSPWHLQFSRIAFEANIGLTINIWAVYFFLRGLKQKHNLIACTFLMGMGLYAYHSERIFLPILALILIAVFRREIFRYKNYLVIPVIVGLLTVVPLISVLTDKNALLRLKGTSSLSDETGLLSQSVSWLSDDIANHDLIGKVVDNRRLVWAKTIISGYLSHFSFNWWFVNGDNPRHHAPDTGMLYLWELPFVFIGMYQLFKNKSEATWFIAGWFLIAPIAASPTTELPHAIRTLVFLPTFQIFTALGIARTIMALRENRSVFLRLCVLIACGFAVFNIAYYIDMYYGQMNHDYSDYWQYGYKQAVDYADRNGGKYTQIVVSTKLEQPYMFFLYFLKYDPAKYLAGGGTASGGFAEYRNKFDKYVFRPIDWAKEKKDGSVLYIGKPGEISGSPLEVIDYLNGSRAIIIADH